ncbi:MAG: TonB-dependent receptor [Kiritimatiellaeota bacterium]|nr:TonB-dependent receptor [Kiritimatiellota bacterium]
MTRREWMAGAAAAVLGGAGMAQEVQELREVVVEATPLARALSQMPSSVSVAGREEFAVAGAVMSEDVLRNLVGVDVGGNAGTASEPSVNLRGLTTERLTKRVLVLMDGRRTADLYQGATDFGFLTLDGVERMEVLRGPASYAYGSGAEAGIVTIVSRTGKGLEAPLVEVKAAGGKDDTYYGQLSAGVAEGDVDAFVTVARHQTQGFLKDGEGRRLTSSYWNVNGNVGWQAGEDDAFRLYLGYFATESRMMVNGEREADLDFQNLEWKHLWDSETFGEMAVRLTRSESRQKYAFMPGAYARPVCDLYSFDVAQRLEFGERVSAVAGVNGIYSSATVDNQSPAYIPFSFSDPKHIDEAERTVGIFSEADVSLAEGTTLSLGLRWDKVERFDSTWSPRIGILQGIGDDVDVYASVGQAFRAPSLSDRFISQTDGMTWFQADPNLKSETITATEIGTRWRVTPDTRLEATAFYNRLKNGFDFMRTGETTDFHLPVAQIHNIPVLYTYGLELSAAALLGYGVEAYANYTLVVGKYRTDENMPGIGGHTLAGLPRNKACAGLAWKGERQSHGLMARFTDARWGDAIHSPERRMHSYTTLDWRSRYGLSENFALTLAVNNLLDTRYQVSPEERGNRISWLIGAEARF